MIDWDEIRTQVLPKSGVGVVAPWLVIARPRNPIIRIDLRALDRVEVRTENVADDHDADQDSWETDWPSVLILTCGELDVALFIADGPVAVERLVSEAAPLTRGETTPDLAQILIVGNEPVVVRGECIHVGIEAFRIDEVREYASAGANIPLAQGAVIQAALAMFVVVANEHRTSGSFQQ